ncbi:unnamed protein product, partial [Pylaiella littoralis]
PSQVSRRSNYVKSIPVCTATRFRCQKTPAPTLVLWSRPSCRRTNKETTSAKAANLTPSTKPRSTPVHWTRPRRTRVHQTETPGSPRSGKGATLLAVKVNPLNRLGGGDHVGDPEATAPVSSQHLRRPPARARTPCRTRSQSEATARPPTAVHLPLPAGTRRQRRLPLLAPRSRHRGSIQLAAIQVTSNTRELQVDTLARGVLA